MRDPPPRASPPTTGKSAAACLPGQRKVRGGARPTPSRSPLPPRERDDASASCEGVLDTTGRSAAACFHMHYLKVVLAASIIHYPTLVHRKVREGARPTPARFLSHPVRRSLVSSRVFSHPGCSSRPLHTNIPCIRRTVHVCFALLYGPSNPPNRAKELWWCVFPLQVWVERKRGWVFPRSRDHHHSTP